MSAPNDDPCAKAKPAEAMQEALTARIIQDLKEGVPTWTKPWRTEKGASSVSMPTNAVSGRAYSGCNVLLLWAAAMERGYRTHGWATFKQAQEMGARVRKGERSTTVIYVKFRDHKDDADKPEGKRRKVPMLRAYYAFNLDQLENVPAAYLKPPRMLPESEAHLEAVKFTRDSGLRLLQFGADKAAYYPAGDAIAMPHRDQFTAEYAFEGTLFHELTHASGHKDRLARAYGQKFGDAAYAFEELVAELGSAFFCAQLGIPPTTRTNAAYIASWIKVLENDYRAITTAASYASAAVAFMTQKVADTRIERLEEDLQPYIEAAE